MDRVSGLVLRLHWHTGLV